MREKKASRARARSLDIREKKKRRGLEKLIKFYNTVDKIMSVWVVQRRSIDQRPGDAVKWLKFDQHIKAKP